MRSFMDECEKKKAELFLENLHSAPLGSFVWGDNESEYSDLLNKNPEIFTNNISLIEIYNKLQNNAYSNYSDFFHDIHLISENCEIISKNAESLGETPESKSNLSMYNGISWFLNRKIQKFRKCCNINMNTSFTKFLNEFNATFTDMPICLRAHLTYQSTLTFQKFQNPISTNFKNRKVPFEKSRKRTESKPSGANYQSPYVISTFFPTQKTETKRSMTKRTEKVTSSPEETIPLSPKEDIQKYIKNNKDADHRKLPQRIGSKGPSTFSTSIPGNEKINDDEPIFNKTNKETQPNHDNSLSEYDSEKEEPYIYSTNEKQAGFFNEIHDSSSSESESSPKKSTVNRTKSIDLGEEEDSEADSLTFITPMIQKQSKAIPNSSSSSDYQLTSIIPKETPKEIPQETSKETSKEKPTYTTASQPIKNAQSMQQKTTESSQPPIIGKIRISRGGKGLPGIVGKAPNKTGGKIARKSNLSFPASAKTETRSTPISHQNSSAVSSSSSSDTESSSDASGSQTVSQSTSQNVSQNISQVTSQPPSPTADGEEADISNKTLEVEEKPAPKMRKKPGPKPGTKQKGRRGRKPKFVLDSDDFSSSEFSDSDEILSSRTRKKRGRKKAEKSVKHRPRKQKLTEVTESEEDLFLQNYEAIDSQLKDSQKEKLANNVKAIIVKYQPGIVSDDQEPELDIDKCTTETKIALIEMLKKFYQQHEKKYYPDDWE